MLKRLKTARRRRKLKRMLKSHASEILVGVAMGLLTDIATDVAQRMLAKKYKKFR